MEPDITQARVTPGALVLLVKLHHDDLHLREIITARRAFMLFTADESDGERACGHAVRRLGLLGLIERCGTLPPDWRERHLDYDWRISAAGHAWIAANTLKCGKIGQLVG